MPKHVAFPILLILLALGGCAVNPVTGERELSLLSQTAVQKGIEQYRPAQQMQGGEWVVDPQLTRYVSNLGQKIGASSGVPLPYEFVILNASSPNAWALPGGKIAINRGLLMMLENEAELAAVLAHEVVHAAAGHGAQRMRRDMITQGLLVAAGAGLQIAGVGDGNQVVGIARDAAYVLGLRYSRDAEREADFYGTGYLAKAGYDPLAAVSLQEEFVKLSQGRQQQAPWLTSHPPSRERVQNNRVRAQQLLGEGYTQGRLGRESYQSATRILRESADAYDLYDDAAKLYGENETDAALQLVTQALNDFNAEPNFHALRGAIRMRQGRVDDAITNFDRAIARNSGYFAYPLMRGRALRARGDLNRARADLQQSVRLLPTSDAYLALGGIAEDTGDTDRAKIYYEQAAQSGGGSAAQQASIRYVALDIAQQPGRYVQVQVRPGEGYVDIVVRNRVNVDLANVLVQVEVDNQRRSLNVASLPGSSERGQRLALSNVTPASLGQAYAVKAEVAAAQ